MIMFKALGVMRDGNEILVEPIPNYGREPAFSWDAYLDVPDPDALRRSSNRRGVVFAVRVRRTEVMTGVKRFRNQGTLTVMGLFFGNHRA
jgi:hypothetical protein